MYLLTDARAIAALADRARAGCDVRVILEPAPYLNEDANQPAFAALAAAGAAVRWSSPRFSYTHAKALIVDHARLAVMTLNLTGAGLAGNREYAALDDDAADVAAAEAVFAADATGATAGARARLVASPDTSRAVLTDLIEQAAVVARDRDGGADRPGDRRRAAGRPRARRQRSRSSGRGLPTRAPPLRRWRRPARPCAPWPRRPSTPRSWSPTGARFTSGSANFTPTSLDRNRELGLRLDDAEPRPARRRDRRRRRRPRRCPVGAILPDGMRSDDQRTPDTPAHPTRPTGRPTWRSRSRSRSAASRSTSSGWRKSCSGSAASRSRVCESTQRNLRWLVIGTAVILVVMWVRSGAALDRGGFVTLGLIVIGLLAAFVLRGRGKS